MNDGCRSAFNVKNQREDFKLCGNFNTDKCVSIGICLWLAACAVSWLRERPFDVVTLA